MWRGVVLFFFKQKTAYEMRISDWSSDVCSSDLTTASTPAAAAPLDVPAGAPLAEFFQKYDEAQLSLSPQTKAYRGIRDGDYGKWDDVSDEAEVARHKLQQATAAAMRASYDPANLSPDDALSFELFNAQIGRAHV